MPFWTKVQEPVFNDKGVPPNHPNLDSKVRGFAGITTNFIGAVRVDFNHSLFHIWFQDVGWQTVSFAPRKIVDFDPTVHMQGGWPRLKIWLAEWPDATGGEPKTTILDTGWSYV